MAGVLGEARQAKNGSLEKAARAGYLTKGIVYVLIGAFAFRTAIGSAVFDAERASSSGALREVARQPFGTVLLALVGLGLAGYAIWRFVQAAKDPDGHGTDAKGIAVRIGYVVSGFVHVALAALAASIVLGGSGGGAGASGGSQARDAWTAKLMGAPAGRWLVALLGLVVVGVGVYHFARAAKKSFLKRMKILGLDPRARTWLVRACSAGLVARGVVFLIVGGFLVLAAYQHDPSEARGLGGALQALYEQPYGAWLLGTIGLGLVAYGVYCFTNARYRRIATS